MKKHVKDKKYLDTQKVNNVWFKNIEGTFSEPCFYNLKTSIITYVNIVL